MRTTSRIVLIVSFVAGSLYADNQSQYPANTDLFFYSTQVGSLELLQEQNSVQKTLKNIEPTVTFPSTSFSRFNIDGLQWAVEDGYVVDILATSSEWVLGNSGIKVGDSVESIFNNYSESEIYSVETTERLKLITVQIRNLEDNWRHGPVYPWILFYYSDSGKICDINIGYPVP